ncbi:MAG: exodeoxyribonuclease III [Flavobacteriaceae bacterium]
MRIATWNINSVRLRIDLVESFIRQYSPDVLCLQEIKCPNDAFPMKRFAKLGYAHADIHGQKGYHGVATLSRLPAHSVGPLDFCKVGDCRHLATDIETAGGRVRVHNFYIPAGGDEPDPAINPKFAHKLAFLDELDGWTGEKAHLGGLDSAIALGDFNIAPLEDDVWSHKQLLKVVSHTPVETEKLVRWQQRGNFVDLARQHTPPPEKLFTWWSYRARDWDVSNRGRRLDHIWSTPDIAPAARRIEIVRDARGWERPSDHVPVIADFSF